MYSTGPWSLEETHENSSTFRITAANGRVIVILEWVDENDIEANARLIAAAPELLEALRDLTEVIIILKRMLKGRADNINLTPIKQLVAKIKGN